MGTLAKHIPRTLIADDQPDALAALRLLLHSGDRLLLFTDGLTEVRNAAGEEFGER